MDLQERGDKVKDSNLIEGQRDSFCLANNTTAALP